MKRSLEILGRVGLLALTVIVTGAIIWVMYWWPVIDRLANWCEYYPQSLANCQE